MIVVVGSRHDPVAVALARSWPSAALCAAEDLVRPGWRWRSATLTTRQDGGRWVVDGEIVNDADVTGVFVRRSGVYPEEFPSTHPDDRAYLAAESHAFLVFLLSATRATVANPVVDGALGEEAIRAERWLAAAAQAKTEVVPLRVTDDGVPRRAAEHFVVEVVGDEAFGLASTGVKMAARRIVRRLGLAWATVLFDRRQRLLAVTAARPPGEQAIAALGRLLAEPGRA